MKSTLLFFLFLLFSFSLFAQNNEVKEKPLPFNLQDNLNTIGNISATSIGGQGFDLRYEGVKGNPFLYEKWYPAHIKIEGKLYEDQKVKYMINLEKQMIVGRFKSGRYTSVSMTAFEEIHIQKDDQNIVFIILPPSDPRNDLSKAMLCEVLYNGANQFLKHHYKIFKKADYENAYSLDVRYDEYQVHAQYFIDSADGSFTKIKLKKKALTKSFPHWEKQLKAFAKKNKSMLSTEKDLKLFLVSLEN